MAKFVKDCLDVRSYIDIKLLEKLYGRRQGYAIVCMVL